MSCIPPFKLGVWNAWILMIYFPLTTPLMKVIDRFVGAGDILKKMGKVSQDKREKRNYTIFMILTFFILAYSIFLPLKVGTAWFYVGLVIYLLGLAALITSMVNITITPLGQVFTKGLYRYSRHPGYISMLLLNLGVAIASASWIFLLYSILNMVFLHSQALAEERGCLETYGEEYKDYMHRTPRWLGLPRSE